MDHENSVMQWGAILIIANLAAVDSDRKIDLILERYLEPISGPVMITAANTIGGAAIIAMARPDLADQIASAMLDVEQAQYQTDECRSIALGHAVKAFLLYFKHIKNPQPVIEFIRRQLNNSRKGVKLKAMKFLKKYEEKNPVI
jgi:hypothetical protein